MGRTSFQHLDLMLSIKDGEEKVLEYIKNNPVLAIDYITTERFDIEMKLLKIERIALFLAKIVSDIK